MSIRHVHTLLNIVAAPSPNSCETARAGSDTLVICALEMELTRRQATADHIIIRNRPKITR